MSIRKKILIVFFSIMATIAGALVIFSQTVLLNKFIAIENEKVSTNLETINSSIQREIIDFNYNGKRLFSVGCSLSIH